MRVTNPMKLLKFSKNYMVKCGIPAVNKNDHEEENYWLVHDLILNLCLLFHI